MPPKVAVSWSQFKPPATAEQRIAFLEVCQREFQTVHVVGPVSAALYAAGTPTLAPPTFVALDNVPTPVSRAACFVCAASSRSAVTANPFADWNVVLCPACTNVA